jgi:hypothetical protein
VTVVFVDLETTGLDPARHELWDVGIVTDDDQEIEFHVRPSLTTADPGALRLTRMSTVVTWRRDSRPCASSSVSLRRHSAVDRIDLVEPERTRRWFATLEDITPPAVPVVAAGHDCGELRAGEQVVVDEVRNRSTVRANWGDGPRRWS